MLLAHVPAAMVIHSKSHLEIIYCLQSVLYSFVSFLSQLPYNVWFPQNGQTQVKNLAATEVATGGVRY